jgi:glycogen debranching enzyme
MSAGLPHFSTDYMRCWGRDTMISLRGLLLIPQKFKEARNILLMFAIVMRHGLIPNLHDRGNSTRFNARDATWFFMEALQQYILHDKEHGADILNEKLDMQFLDWNQSEHFKKLTAGHKNMMLMADVVQTMMQAHASGIDYVEWNAGLKIDAQMTQEGFHVKIGLDPATGFIYGGNKFNCGTWMDKMGSSEKAKNKGIPGSSRDGADVEIIGLLRSAVRFLATAHERGIYPHEGVTLPEKKSTLTYKQWV